jgi:acyl carrier protein
MPTGSSAASSVSAVGHFCFSGFLPTALLLSAAVFIEMDDLEETVRKFVSVVSKVSEDQINPATQLGTDLGMDSLDRVELAMALEEHFRISLDDGEICGTSSVEDTAALVRASLV